ncbi:MAG: LytR C-terminal domain-containing protein [Candidatus Sedimenticola endophacoides]
MKPGYMLWIPNNHEIAATRVPDPADVNGLDQVAIEVSTGNGRRGMANMIATYLRRHGAEITRLTNQRGYDVAASVIYYVPEYHSRAVELARRLPVKPRLIASGGDAAQAPLRLILGADLLGHEGEIRRTFLRSNPA